MPLFGEYNSGGRYNNYPAYTYFDPQSPLGMRNLGISASGISGTTYVQRGSAFTLTKGRKIIRITARTSVSSVPLSVALYTIRTRLKNAR